MNLVEKINAARIRLIQMHFKSGVGHLGGNLSSLDALMLIYHDFLDLENDKFILSKGHAAGALYVVLWSLGYLSDGDLDTFHCDDTKLGGHPQHGVAKTIEFSTGSLGHGLSLAAGLALGFRFKESKNRVFCITSDGEWQEGSTWEALIFAAHHKLSNLIILVDHNNLQGFGNTGDVASMSPLWCRIKGFDVEIAIVDGHNIYEISQALNISTCKPKIIFLKTIKGFGVPSIENTLDSHYIPLSIEAFEEAMRVLKNEE